MRYEEPESDQPTVIGTLYLQKWAAHRLEDPETVTITSGLKEAAALIRQTGLCGDELACGGL